MKNELCRKRLLASPARPATRVQFNPELPEPLELLIDRMPWHARGLSLTCNYFIKKTQRKKQNCSGDLSDMDPPDPIPNSEVKRISANNT